MSGETKTMEMYFCPLYSGSSGNSLYCQYGSTRLLIDAGKPGRRITDALAQIGVAPESLSGVLVTHEHSDHILGVGVLARRYGLPVYATRGTWLGMEEKIGPVSSELRREIVPGRDIWYIDWRKRITAASLCRCFYQGNDPVCKTYRIGTN